MTKLAKKAIKFIDSILILLAVDGLSIVFLILLFLISLIRIHIVVKSLIIFIIVLTYIYSLVKINKLK